ncbi:MAG: hypothetical protein RH862_15530 [Leptospiraceae bacterium]
MNKNLNQGGFRFKELQRVEDGSYFMEWVFEARLKRPARSLQACGVS